MTTIAPALPVSARAQSAAARSAAVEKVVGVMRASLDTSLSLEEMAGLAYLSPFYFNRVFRQVTGVPPRRFHTALRMAAAKRMLLTTDLSVTEICLDLGYQSLGTFTTHFHELVGLSPRGLRQLGSDPPLPTWDLITAIGEGESGDPACPPLDCRVDGPIAWAGAMIFVGLFNGVCPQGVPAACTARVGPGRIRLRATPEPHNHLAAVAFARSDDPRAYLLPRESDLMVASSPAPVGGGMRGGTARPLRLRPVRSTDPPLLLALPGLLARRIAQHGALA